MKFIIKSICVFAFLSSVVSSAQQTPNYTFWRQNLSSINPAYAGSTEKTEINIIGLTNQWNGAGDSPKTQSLLGHTSFNKVGLGLELVQDKIFIQRETNVFVNFSYKLQVSGTNHLYLGLKTGGSFFNVDFSRLETVDPINQGKVDNKFNPNFGIGAYFKTDNYFLSLSAPRILKAKRYEEIAGAPQSASDETLITFGGGYFYNINDDIELTPAIIARYVNGAPFSFDFTATARLYKKAEVGINYRLDDSIFPMATFEIANTLVLGFTYGFPVSENKEVSDGSAEFLLKLKL